jgi:hypothetical protein
LEPAAIFHLLSALRFLKTMKTTPLHRHPAMKRTLASALLALVAASALQADVPLFINYQGRVTDSNGAAIGAGTPVNRKVIFRIWDHPSNTAVGNRLYTEEQTVTIFNGEFSVLIGQGIAFPSGSPEAKPALDTVFGALSPSTTDRYLEILVDNGDNSINTTDQPITPRQQMTSVGYAMRAKVADSVAPGFDLNLNGSPNYGLGYYGGTRLFSSTVIDGPVLFGVSGGALGSDNGTTEITALRWNNSGQVGIGSNTLLGVAGTTKLLLEGNDTTAPPKQLTIRGTSDTNKRLHLGYNTTSNYGAFQAYSAASTGANLLLNQAGGNVGIGGTTTPGERLTIVGADTSSTGFALGVWNSTPAPLFSVRNDGNVGIGTANPVFRLQVTGGNAAVSGAAAADSVGWVGVTNTGVERFGLGFAGGAGSWSTDAAVGDAVLRGTNGKLLLLSGSGASAICINTSNNVGIGTTIPAQKLDVIGGVQSQWLEVRANAGTPFIDFTSNTSTDYHARIIWLGTGTNRLDFEAPGYMFNTGAVGIGTSPNVLRARLTVGSVFTSAGVNTPFPQGRYMDNTSTGAQNQTWGGGTVSIEATANIVCNGVFATSDERIKKVAGHSDGAADLKTLLDIKVTDYVFKDQIANGGQPQKKVIAQQVEKIFPQAVSQGTNTVPDIFKKAAIKDGWVSLTTDLKKGDRVKLIDDKDAEAIHEVLEVKKDKFLTDFKTEAKNVFVYGREVKDFRRVDYEAISMLNVSATQQIKKEKDAEVKLLKDENAELKAKLAAQDTRLATLEAQTQRLADLEAKDKARDAKLAAIEKLLAADKAAVKPVSLKKSSGGAE